MPAEDKIFEVHRLAQQAHSKADSASYEALAAKSDIAHHEKICAERYATINGQLHDIKAAASKSADATKESTSKIYETLHRLEVAIATQANTASTKSSTTDLLIRWGCGLGGLSLGFISLAYAIMQNVH